LGSVLEKNVMQDQD